jgi:hypothetical protein
MLTQTRPTSLIFLIDLIIAIPFGNVIVGKLDFGWTFASLPSLCYSCTYLPVTHIHITHHCFGTSLSTSKCRTNNSHQSDQLSVLSKTNRHLPTDEKIRAHDYRFCCSLVARNDPNICSTCIRSFSESCLKASDKEHPETHEKGTNEKHRSTTPFVNVDNGTLLWQELKND